MKKLMLNIICFSMGGMLNAQAPNLQWAKSMGGSSTDYGNCVATDANGNVYTTGYFQGTADFDPGVGTFNLTSNVNGDVFVSKFDAAGNFVWAKQMGGVGMDWGSAIAIDQNGNVYTTGYFSNTADFDPGAGTFNLISGGNTDIFVSKLDASGNFVWAKQFGSVFADEGYGICLDASGNVYSTGRFAGNVDFDPSAAVSNLNSFGGTVDIYVSKLDAAGNFVWAKQLGGSVATGEYGYAITTDASGNVYTTGYFTGTADFDPGAGTFTLVSNGLEDIFISKLNSSGNFVWAKQLGGNSNDYGFMISVDGGGNVITAGLFSTTSDFDPGAGIYNLTTFGAGDCFVSKLDAAGNFVWAKQIGGTSSDACNSLCTDASGNVYTTGYFQVTADMDPGAGTYTFASNGSNDMFVNKLDASGNFIWAVQMGGSLNDGGISISLNPTGNIYASCNFFGTADFDPGAGTFTLTPVGNADVAIIKLGTCVVPSQPGSIVGSTIICDGTSTIYSVTPVAGATSYTWTLPSGWSGTSSTNTISGIPGTSGIIGVTASNSCAAGPQQTLNVSVNPLPTLSVNSTTICTGSAFTITPEGASTYSFSGGSAVVSPSASTNYTVIGTSTLGCSSTIICSVTVIVCTGIQSSQNTIENTIFTLYPNPTLGVINIELNKSKEITLLQIANAEGKLLIIRNIEAGRTQLDLTHLPQGIYFVSLKQKDLIKTLKLIKE